MNQFGPLGFRARFIFGSSLISLSLLLITASWTIPFTYKSTSLFYKFGLHRTLLLGGQVVGITAAMLIFMQIFLVSRPRILDRIFGLNRLYNCHRLNGYLVVALSLLHPALILAAERFTLFPFEKRYWPQFLGVVLAVSVVVLVLVAFTRRFIGLGYENWRRMHRPVGILIISATLVHLLYVSDTFAGATPKNLALTIGGLNLLILFRIWYRRLAGRKRFAISKVEAAGVEATTIEAVPVDGRPLRYFPGQFVFVTTKTDKVKREEHPFTIASSPSHLPDLQFVVRACGDWTSQVKDLVAGDDILVDGPYGLFSYRLDDQGESLIMVAGGIGITPMLSMLRELASHGDRRRLLLIWSNRTPEYFLFNSEFDQLRARLPNLEIVHIHTRHCKDGCEPARLNQQRLAEIIEGYSRSAKVFICGPPTMMNELAGFFRGLGFKAASIYRERFEL